jgi:hypothetical protein
MPAVSDPGESGESKDAEELREWQPFSELWRELIGMGISQRPPSDATIDSRNSQHV